MWLRDCNGHLIKPTAVNFQWLVARLWFGRARDYLDSEEWQQSSFVIGPRNDKDFVGYPSGGTVSPRRNHPLIFARSRPPPTFLLSLRLAHTHTHTHNLPFSRYSSSKSWPNAITCWQSDAYEFACVSRDRVLSLSVSSSFFTLTRSLTAFQVRWIEEKFILTQKNGRWEVGNI